MFHQTHRASHDPGVPQVGRLMRQVPPVPAGDTIEYISNPVSIVCISKVTDKLFDEENVTLDRVLKWDAEVIKYYPNSLHQY